MNLRQTLTKAKFDGASAFIPFIMAFDPNREACADVIVELQAAGAAALELGVPFSDPVADGLTVQKAAERALAAGATLKGVLDLVRQVRARGVTMPICLFSYVNPVWRMGYDVFAKEACAAGVNGALIVDLPPEAAEDYLAAARSAGLETVFLCSPTTAPERLALIDRVSTGFVYYVSREGVTGAQAALPEQLSARLAALGETLQNPVAVGFGISTAAHVRQLTGKAAGIVVGSALVKIVESNPASAAEEVGAACRDLVAGLRGG